MDKEQLPTLDEVRAEVARRTLSEYVKQAWKVVEPTVNYKHGWHIDAICYHLEAVSNGEIRDLIITMPPRHMKSLTVSVFWPTWMWIDRPETKFLYSSYSSDLATRDSLKSRRIIESQWYRGNWGDRFKLSGDQNLKKRFENNQSGYRMATSVDGMATGEGGDYLVVDDPHSVTEAPSDTMRQHTIDWWDQTMSTRLNDPSKGGRIIVMQRIHEADLAGHLLERKPNIQLLCLPAEYEPGRCRLRTGWEDPRKEKGDLLWPEQWGKVHLDEKKIDLGSYGYAGQYQQRPAPAEGGILKRAWFQYYTPKDLPFPDEIIQSWDLAFKDSDQSDYVVGQVWLRHGADKYLLRQKRERLDFPGTCDGIIEFFLWVQQEYPDFASHRVFVEEAANGAAVISALRRQIGTLIGVKPVGGKESRAHAAAAQLEAGSVYIPGRQRVDEADYDAAYTPVWVQDLVEECVAFPNAAHDDQVDALSQALLKLGKSLGTTGARIGYRTEAVYLDI